MTGEIDLGGLPEELRRRAAAGATLLELIELIHEAEGQKPYSRGLVMHWFSVAFRITPDDFHNVIVACALFGDGASVPLEEAERRFRNRVSNWL